jgi:hypothetical protein
MGTTPYDPTPEPTFAETLRQDFALAVTGDRYGPTRRRVLWGIALLSLVLAPVHPLVPIAGIIALVLMGE